jgi:hypothetical protein
VIHDWDDASATSILGNCRAAASANTRLLLIERVMPARMTASPAGQRGAVLDIRMLLVAGGRERTEEEYRALLASSGFTLTRTVMLPEPIDMAVIEAVPRAPWRRPSGIACRLGSVSRFPDLALFGLGATSDLSLLCAQERTSLRP